MTPYDTGESKDLTEEKATSTKAGIQRPSRSEAEAAIELLLRWMGENPGREGLVGTPERVVRAWEEFVWDITKIRPIYCSAPSKMSRAMMTW